MLSNLELLNSSEEDLEWFNNNFSTIQRQFQHKVVAIKDKSVVASAKNGEELIKTLRDKGIDEDDVLIEVISQAGEITIL